MLKQSVYSSLISASLANKFLKDQGLLTLAGAAAALEPTPGSILNMHNISDQSLMSRYDRIWRS